MSKTDLAKLTPEQLMEIAILPVKDDKLKELEPVLRFIISDGLEKGDYPIPASIIFGRYLKWCAAYNVQPLSHVKFFSNFKVHFQKVTKPSVAYILSPKGFDLSPQNLAICNRQVKRNSNGKKKTKKEDIQE